MSEKNEDELAGLNIPNFQNLYDQSEQAQKQNTTQTEAQIQPAYAQNNQNAAEQTLTPQTPQPLNPPQSQMVTNINISNGANRKTLSNIKTKRTGCTVCGIIFTVLALIMTGVTAWRYFAVFMGMKDAPASGFLTFLVFLIWDGWFTYLPALAFAITGVSCSAVGTKSVSKGQKAACIIFLIFSIIDLVVLTLMFVFAGLFVDLPS